MRLPILPGNFYESDFTKLNNQLEVAFEQGPGSTPVERRSNNVLAAIVPNLPYKKTAQFAAWAYKEIAETPQPFTYVVIGASNSQIEKAVLSLQDFSTPFGSIMNDRNLANKLIDRNIIVDEDTHKKEHSIEIQLPFLQFSNKQQLNTLRILPVIISSLDEALIKNTAKKLAMVDNLIYIASSNLFHYGPKYGFTPFRYNLKNEIEYLRNSLLDSAISIDPYRFLSLTNKTGLTFGFAPIVLLLEILKIKNAKRGQLLSNELVKEEENNIVGIASIVYNK